MDIRKQISSAANADVKRLVTYRDKARARKKDGLFLIEGTRLFLDTPEQYIREIFLSAQLAGNCPAAVEQKAAKLAAAGIPVTELTDEVFRHITDTVTPQGILCTVLQPAYRLEDLLHGEWKPLVLILDGIQDPGNLGTIFRSAAAAGATGILMSRDTVDITGPKAVRSTMSAIFRTPYMYSADLPADIVKLRQQGLKIFAAAADRDSIYTRMPWEEACAVVIGNEGNGITAPVMEAADLPVSIPMHADMESLNAAVAASILLFAAAARREGL